MENEKLNHLALMLIKKTEANQALWEPTSRNDEFRLEFSQGFVTIGYWEDEMGKNVDFNIFNQDGHLASNFSTSEMEISMNDRSLDILRHNLLTLYKKVIGSYTKLDATYESIIKELQEEKIVGNNSQNEDDIDDLPF